MPRVPLALGLLLALLCAAGCDERGSGGAGPGVVATTPQTADLVRQVGGARVDLEPVLPSGADPHDYEPRPSDAAAIARAALVFRSGGEVDDWLGELIDNAGGDAEEVSLIDAVKIRPGAGDDPDPHWWQDPRNAIRAVRAIEAALSRADPAGAPGYRRRAAAFTRELRALDAAIARCLERVPAGERKLVTTHDSLGYFAGRYDLEVIGSVIPSLSTQAQPSARAVGELVDRMEAEGVRAVFPEAAVSQRLERAIAREAGVTVGGELLTDALGDEGSASATYIGAMRHNARALARGLSGGRVGCRF